jgi:SAM-dependent methyltransferase
MKHYFEYQITPKVEQWLKSYYEDLSLDQHTQGHYAKFRLKLKRIRKLVDFNKEDRVLDFGCSQGQILKSIAPEINEGLGVDISTNIIELNKSTNNLNNVNFAVLNGDKIPSTALYNKVLLLDVLEHALNPDDLMVEIIKAMSEDGILIIEVPFTGCLSEWVLGKYHQGHLRYYDPEYIVTYLEKHGLSVSSRSVYNSIPYSSLFLKIPPVFFCLDRLVNVIPNKYYPYFGEIILVAKRKK